MVTSEPDRWDGGLPGQPGILELLASGRVSSRTDIARELGLAASTVSLRVQELIDAGLVVESGSGRSTGGRRPKVLRIDPDAGHVLAADLGGHHVRFARLDLLGNLQAVEEIAIDVADGPEVVLDQMSAQLTAMHEAAGGVLRGVAACLPGPVDAAAGCVDSPSRMPGWHRFPVRERLAERFGVPCVVDNDANLMALAEHRNLPGARHSLLVKAGAAIGCGLIIGGDIYRGGTGAAGDITHVRVAAAGDRACSCGNVGCLETIASGSALVRSLRENGHDVATTTDVVRAAMDGEPLATTTVRRAGRSLGETLSPVVNFVNPDAVFLAGLLSTVEPFVAAVRSQLYEGCHPLATRDLQIVQAGTGADAGVIGAGRLILTQVLAGTDTSVPVTSESLS
ncbi:putative NBD/HSP70 family sugar kinase [Haloactinopolyspora alba]|uniref:Putative NBD/HSP70 family sugar kinase n=1 Tax=Haloactinopolyspora alba TaxID=648780 RepID=A0A2P8DYD6_9ACTN|nr:ROK family transcriptional regulator [Haloactinopolyspora alba]PSL02202.1 putative NBD/HSP70 family sugar kinase [Haloactinopolyspora alba]